jgi:hypothetical protein
MPDPNLSSYGPYQPGAEPAAPEPALMDRLSGIQAARGTEMPTSIAPAIAPAIPLQNADQTLDNLQKQSVGTRMMHGILDALGGKFDTQFVATPDGVIRQDVPATPGQQAKKIIAGAIMGWGAGAQAAGTGPGAAMRAAGAGVQAGAKMAQDAREQQSKEAQTEFETQQKAALQQAQISMLGTQRLNLQWQMSDGQRKAGQEEIDRANQQNELLSKGGPGTRLVGHAPDLSGAMGMTQKDPSLHDLHAGTPDGQLIYVDHINPDGKHNGVDAWYVTKSYLDSPITEPIRRDHEVMEDGKMVIKHDMIPAGTSHRDVNNLQTLDGNEFKANELQKAQIGHLQAVTEEAHSAARKNDAERVQLNNAVDQNTINNNAMQLVEGTLDPSNLSKRGKSYDATLAAATAYSQAKYGANYDIAKAAGDYKFANDYRTKNTLAYMNSLVGADNLSGNFQEFLRLSDQYKRTNYPALNDVKAWADIQRGDPEIGRYRAVALDVADQAAKILQGGGSGSGSTDAKLKQAVDLYNARWNQKQISGIIDETRMLIANRKKEMIGDNVYLNRWYGPQHAAAPTGGSQKTVTDDRIAALPSSSTQPPGAVKSIQGSDKNWYWLSVTGDPIAKDTSVH